MNKQVTGILRSGLLGISFLLPFNATAEAPPSVEPARIDLLELIQLEVDPKYRKENTQDSSSPAEENALEENPAGENTQAEKPRIGPTCTQGSERELETFFSDQHLIRIAEGKRIRQKDQREEISDVAFFLSKDMDFFHVVTLKEERRDFFNACIISSAREIDFQIAPPVPDLLEREHREHLLFLNEIPKTGICPPEKNNCTTWNGPELFIGTDYLLTGYLYSRHWELDAYTQIVDVRLENKVIQPTRGTLTAFAREKYAARLRNELNESNSEISAAKDAYRNIYNEVDHGHPLYMFILEEDGAWNITMIDRHRGLVWVALQGNQLEIYPLSKREYREFLEE